MNDPLLRQSTAISEEGNPLAKAVYDLTFEDAPSDVASTIHHMFGVLTQAIGVIANLERRVIELESAPSATE